MGMVSTRGQLAALTEAVERSILAEVAEKPLTFMGLDASLPVCQSFVGLWLSFETSVLTVFISVLLQASKRDRRFSLSLGLQSSVPSESIYILISLRASKGRITPCALAQVLSRGSFLSLGPAPISRACSWWVCVFPSGIFFPASSFPPARHLYIAHSSTSGGSNA